MLSSPEMRIVVSSCFFLDLFVKGRATLHVLSFKRKELFVVDVGWTGMRNQNDLDNRVSGDESLDAITIENFEACFP